jgi:hypothetical protein
MTLLALYKAKLFTKSFYYYFFFTELQLKPKLVCLMPGSLENAVGDSFALPRASLMDKRDGSRTGKWIRPVSIEKLVYKFVNS